MNYENLISFVAGLVVSAIPLVIVSFGKDKNSSPTDESDSLSVKIAAKKLELGSLESKTAEFNSLSAKIAAKKLELGRFEGKVAESNSLFAKIAAKKLELGNLLESKTAEFNSLSAKIAAKKLELGSLESKIAQKESRLLAVQDLLPKVMESLDKGLGFSITELQNLSYDLTQFSISANSEKVNKYIERLKNLNKERREAFAQKPVITASASRIEETKPFNQSREQFIERERNLCKQVAQDNNINCTNLSEKMKCKIVKVVDGDTFDVVVDNKRFRVRAAGYDTPEVCHPYKDYGHWGIQASEAAEKIVANGTNFYIYLDKKGQSIGWTNDRYGRIIAHIEIDGILIGETLIKGGFARAVDAFPIEDGILFLYSKSEHFAKINNIGMWEDINRYKESKKSKIEKTWTLDRISENANDIKMTKTLLTEALNSLIGELIVKAKNSLVIHSEDCHYVSSIGNPSYQQIDEAWITNNSGKIRPCKHCKADSLIQEVLS